MGHCIHCQPCRITTGFSGAGAFSDGKLSLSREVGGDLPELIGHQFAQDTIDRVDQMYLDFGADPHVEGLGHADEVAEIRRRAISAGLKLVDCPIRHLGTEKAQELYARIEKHLLDAGVNILFETECDLCIFLCVHIKDHTIFSFYKVKYSRPGIGLIKKRFIFFEFCKLFKCLHLICIAHMLKIRYFLFFIKLKVTEAYGTVIFCS